jgi:predicted metal-dependent HD superfamily phosphohydrolase
VGRLTFTGVSTGPRPPFGRTQTESGGAQPTHEFAALHDLGAGSDHVVAVLLGDVVVVALEPAARNPDLVGELEQFVVRHVRHQMTPLLAAVPPARFVDEDRHRAELATPCHTREVSTAISADDSVPLLDDVWRRHISPETALLARLVRRYREKHRRYHTVAHLGAVVSSVAELAAVEPAGDLGAVIAGAVYHDAVYEPASPSNERASARLARRDLSTLGWADERIVHVAHMIETTCDHRAPTDHDHALLFDADLGILGALPGDYAAYVDAVRAEHRHVDDEAWRIGRRRVLESFLERANVYATSAGRSRWEDTARANLAAELAALTG